MLSILTIIAYVKEINIFELLCDLQEAITRAGWLHNPEFWQLHKEGSQQQKEEYEEHKQDGDDKHVFSLADFVLGPVIDKGCNAVVYAARWRTGELNGLPSSSCVSLPHITMYGFLIQLYGLFHDVSVCLYFFHPVYIYLPCHCV